MASKQHCRESALNFDIFTLVTVISPIIWRSEYIVNMETKCITPSPYWNLFVMSEEPTKEQIIAILDYFAWNWELAADHLKMDPKELRESFIQEQQYKPKVLTTQPSFSAGHISKDSVQMAQNFINEHLTEQLPLLFKKNMTDEEKHNMAQAILVEKGVTYKLTHFPEFIDAYNALEDEALQLEKWREQGTYLTLLENALFKIVATQSKQ